MKKSPSKTIINKLFLQKSSTIDVWLGSKSGSWQYCQISIHSVKLFIFILIMHILFYSKNWKKLIAERNWTYKAYLLTEETSSWFPLIESLKITCARSYAWFLNFYWIVFCKISYPNLSNCDLSKVPKRKQIESILTCPKLAKWISTLNCSK